MEWLARCAARRSIVLLLALAASAAVASPAAHIVRADLPALIRAAANSPHQFAVEVPHVASLVQDGSWSIDGDRATWRYIVRVPTAVSMSFHATRIALPRGAQLSVRSAVTTVHYTARDLRRTDLWSRIQPGDTLEFRLSVPRAARRRAVLELGAVQAGYRSLGAGAHDHPYYQRLKAGAASADNSSCVQNYMCSATAANTAPAQATVGLVVANLYQCTGVLINDVPGDNSPYVLTSRSCETGRAGGGNAGAAWSTTVYWDAASACGQALGSLYDPTVATQTGATPVVEQQDAWLIKLDTSPVVSDARFAGFDASGGAVQGGYSIHHALGLSKQYTAWIGPALATQANLPGTTYTSSFWETVNQSGNMGPGASGAGFFDQSDRLVGLRTLARATNDATGYESCPVSAPTAPNGANGTADFTSIAAVWNLPVDPTGFVGSITLKAALDPAATGTTVVPSVPSTPISFTASAYVSWAPNTVELSWNAAGATGCSANGGGAFVGWAVGPLAASGTQTVTEPNPGSFPYSISCSFADGRTVNAVLTITWTSPAAMGILTGPATVWFSQPVTLRWSAPQPPCELNGVDLDLAGLPSTGSIILTPSVVGQTGYTMICGSPGPLASGSWTVTAVTPDIDFFANNLDRIAGEPLVLTWSSIADTCTPTGGSGSDGWLTTPFHAPSATPSFSTTSLAVGRYTYTLTCQSGPLSVAKSLTVNVENDAPRVTASVDASTVTLTDTPADFITMRWDSNLSLCGIDTTPLDYATTAPLPSSTITWAQGTTVFAPKAPGTYPVTVICYGAPPSAVSATSAPITITVLPPPAPTASISISNPSPIFGEGFIITYSSTNAKNCSGFEIAALDSAFPTRALGTSGTIADAMPRPGPTTIGISCPSIDPNQGPASAQVSFTTLSTNPLTIGLSIAPGSVTVGDTFKLTWASGDGTSCTAMGGAADGTDWSGTLPPSGSLTKTATVVGAFAYEISCSDGYRSDSTGAGITVVAATVGPPLQPPPSGGGGGGAIGLLELGALAALASLRDRRERPRRASR